MSGALAIEIHDAGIVVVARDGVRLSSPAIAVGEGDTLHIGAAAAARNRLNPRRTVDRFWERLDQEEFPTAIGAARTRADLAYYHLRHVWQAAGSGADEVILAIPGAFGRNERALLVGIAKACEIPLAGVVEGALAAATTHADPRPRCVLELGAHRLLATDIDTTDGELAYVSSRTVATRGLVELREDWVHAIAARFLRETRFDPLHDARTEQVLYDGLEGWIDALRSAATIGVELAVGGRTYRIELTRNELTEPLRTFYEDCATAIPFGRLALLGDRLASLPGALEALGGVALQPGAQGRGALGHLTAIRSDASAPAFVTRLPGAIEGATAVVQGVASSRSPTATHLLIGATAYAIDGAPLLLDTAKPRRLGRGETTHGCVLRRQDGEVRLDVPAGIPVEINQRRATGDTVLRVGDSVRLAGVHGDAEMRVITVLGEGAPDGEA